ncbi:MAG: hypothetical protein ACUVTM_05850 [Candidatus Bathyarchaeia archaeon]
MFLIVMFSIGPDGFDLEQVDIAATIASLMDMPYLTEGKPLGDIVTYGQGCGRVLLLIIDSLGYRQYVESRSLFYNMWRMSYAGRLYKCKVNADETTPCIASILCGRKPETHRIYKTGDAYKNDRLKSILEVASSRGVKSAVIMEEKGALTFVGRIDNVKPIPDRADIVEFDLNVKEATVEAVREGCLLIVAHMRILDKLGYTPYAVRLLDSNISEITKACGGESLIMLCGDHPPHGSKEYSVPLIVCRVEGLMRGFTPTQPIVLG